MSSSESIKEQIATLDPPMEIRNVDVDFGADSDGEPAIWIYLHVDDNSQAQLVELNKFAQKVQSALLEWNPDHVWPYVRFRTP